MFFKVKVSHIRLGQVLKVPTNSKRLAQDGGKVVSHKHRPPLPVMRYPWYSFTLEPKSASQPGAVGRIVNEKKTIISPGIEHATFWRSAVFCTFGGHPRPLACRTPGFERRLSTALILVMFLGKILPSPRVIPGFRCEVDENCALLGSDAASSGNFLPTFRDNLSGTICKGQE